MTVPPDSGLPNSRARRAESPETSRAGQPILLAGVDGGGTGSRCLIVDPEGVELAWSDGESALVDPAHPLRAARAIAGAVTLAAKEAGGGLPVEALWAGLAGAGRGEARSAVEEALRSMGLARRVRVGMDVEAAHQDAFAGQPGILLTVGTGSMAWGRDSRGREVRAGGWGTLLGEEGSGYWLAVQGLRAVVRGLDGRGPKTGLSTVVLERLGLTDPRSLIPWAASASKADIAELAPLILKTAEAGDGPAGEVRASALRELRLDVVAVLNELDPDGGRFPVALAGGLVEVGSPFRELVVRELEEAGAECLSEFVLPARGAANLALELHREPPPS